MNRLSTVVSIVALTAVSASAAVPTAPQLPPHTLHRLTLPAAATAGKNLDPKLSSWLRGAARRFGLAPTGALVPADPPRSADGKLQVYIDCSTLGPEQLAKLNEVGVSVDGIDPKRARVRGSVDPAALAAVAAFSWVRAVRPVDRAVVRAGSATTEGDAAARADRVRAQGLDGTGVVVGVISDGIDNLQEAQQSGDLPDVTVPAGGCRQGRGDEGTALLEIVHDIAPGATLLFAGVVDSFGMSEAVECLTAAGADVIVDDLGFFGEPYFEDGPVAAAVRAAVQAGVSYHSSAGNEAEQHLEQDFAGTDVHDFGGGDNTDAVVVPAGGTLTCVLEWNDPFGASSNDYDLFLLDENLSLVASSVDPQVGGQDPIEIVSVVNQGNTDAIGNVLIDRFAGEPRKLELFCLGARALEHGTATGSIIGHPALPEVVAVGAIDVADPGLDAVEPFSSRGPARIDFPTREDRAKPDLAAFDGVSISNAGGFPACPPFCAFFGTSAAAPHTAGVAALLLQKVPTLTPAAIQDALRAGAVDIAGAGFDDTSGFGRLDALAAVGTVETGECASDADCNDGDACTIDTCDSALGCASTPLGGSAELACRLSQISAPDVCGPGELDRKTGAAIARTVRTSLALLDETSTAKVRRRKFLLDRIARQLGTLQHRVSRAEARKAVSDVCGSQLAALIGSGIRAAQAVAGTP